MRTHPANTDWGPALFQARCWAIYLPCPTKTPLTPNLCCSRFTVKESVPGSEPRQCVPTAQDGECSLQSPETAHHFEGGWLNHCPQVIRDSDYRPNNSVPCLLPRNRTLPRDTLCYPCVPGGGTRSSRWATVWDKTSYQNETMVPIRPPYSGALEAQGWGSWRHHAQPRKPITTSATAPNKFHQEIWGGRCVTLRVSYKKIQRMMQGYFQTIFKNKLFLYSLGRKKQQSIHGSFRPLSY